MPEISGATVHNLPRGVLCYNKDRAVSPARLVRGLRCCVLQLPCVCGHSTSYNEGNRSETSGCRDSSSAPCCRAGGADGHARAQYRSSHLHCALTTEALFCTGRNNRDAVQKQRRCLVPCSHNREAGLSWPSRSRCRVFVVNSQQRRGISTVLQRCCKQIPTALGTPCGSGHSFSSVTVYPLLFFLRAVSFLARPCRPTCMAADTVRYGVLKCSSLDLIWSLLWTALHCDFFSQSFGRRRGMITDRAIRSDM